MQLTDKNLSESEVRDWRDAGWVRLRRASRYYISMLKDAIIRLMKRRFAVVMARDAGIVYIRTSCSENL